MKHKERLSVLYDLLFSVLAIVAVYFAIYDMTTGCSAIQRDIDFAINTIFIADYALRLLIAKNKKEFFRNNILESDCNYFVQLFDSKFSGYSKYSRC